jgi:hypothetical protein
MEVLILGLTLFATVVIGVIGLFHSHRNNEHFAEQNLIMLAELRGESAPTAPIHKPSQWPVAVMILTMLGVWSVVGFDYYDRHYSAFQFHADQPLRVVRNKTFEHEIVPLDGYDYSDCTFDQVTFLINATAPIRFTHNVTLQPVTIKTENPQVVLVMGALAGSCGLSPMLHLDAPHVETLPGCLTMLKTWLQDYPNG